MKQLIDQDFLLSTQTARTLFHDHAKKLPIIDYHCGLSPRELAEDKQYANIAEAWLYGDRRKWQAMRCCGVEERLITGDGSDYEKFHEYCRIMPSLMGSSLYHLSHRELWRYFDCDLVICEENCDAIWHLTAEKLAAPSMSAKNLVLNSGVALLCTTDDPADALTYHRRLAESDFSPRVLPTFCPSEGMNLAKQGIADYFKTLAVSVGIEITDLTSLERAYALALDRFERAGCGGAYHKTEHWQSFVKPDHYHADQILKKAIRQNGRDVAPHELGLYRAQMMRFFGKEYKRRGWVMQLEGGGNTDAIREQLEYLKDIDRLPRTLIHPAEPSEGGALHSLCRSLVGGDREGIAVMQSLDRDFCGVLSPMGIYIGAVPLGASFCAPTGTFGFLSLSEHEYFRRNLCRIVGEWAETGMVPKDIDALARLVADVCYYNTKSYFGFNV